MKTGRAKLIGVNYDFRGRVVLVTGASSGIGRATAEAFARAGASVALTARAVDAMEAIAAPLRTNGAKIVVHHLDVTNREECFSVVEKVSRDLGRLDILINNAGLGQCCRLNEMEWEDIQRIIDTNLMGVIHCTQAALPVLKRQKQGQIVNISSTVGHKGIPYLSVYCATKFALRGLSESLRMELAKDGIEVISVCPGTTDTEFFKRAITNGEGWWMKAPRIMSSARVADAIVRACARHKREVILTAEGKAMIAINKVAPRFIDYMTLKVLAR